MRTATFLLTVLALSGCASRASSGPSRDSSVIRQMLLLAGSHEADPNALRHDVLHQDTVAAPPDRAWLELIRAWNALRIPVTGVDEEKLWIGGSTVPLGQIAGSRPSAWLDCGHGMADAYADQYEVTFSMAARVVPIQAGTVIQSIVRATAQPRDVSTAAFRCTSRGTLEMRVADAVRARAAPAR